MNKWDYRFLELAEHISSWSKDKTKVSAVIVKDKKVISMGYNGFPKGIADDHRLMDKELKLSMMIHAEENAMIKATSDLTDCSIYVYPLHPCTKCTANIINSGITKVVCSKPSDHHAITYKLTQVGNMFNEAGNIEFIMVG